jgi:Caspase domain
MEDAKMITRSNDDGDALPKGLNGAEQKVPPLAAVRKRALVVGINAYAPPNALPSCVNDARNFAAMLKDEFDFDDVTLCTDEQATKAGLEAGLDKLFSSATADDRLVFFYSGHGYQLPNGDIVDSVLVTQDSQFFSDRELAGKMSALPDGVLTIVLDACFSGGDEKMFVLPGGALERGKVKRWIATPSQLAAQKAFSGAEPSKIAPFGYLTPVRGSDVSRHLSTAMDKAFDDDSYRIAQLQDKDSKGLLLSACLENEEATASTSQTNELSAFTFALLSAVQKADAATSADDLIAEVGRTLRALRLGQTPMLKEPLLPPHLGRASFLLLDADNDRAAKSGASAAPALTPPQDEILLQFLAVMAGLLLNLNAKGVSPMPNDANQKNFLNDVATTVQIASTVAGMLQSKGFQPQAANKGWLDDVGQAVQIGATVASMLQSKGFQPQAANKSWFSDAISDPVQIASTVTGMLQSKDFQPQVANKGWLDDVGQAVQIGATVASMLQSKGFQPQAANKGWLDDVGQAVQIGATVASMLQSKGFQPQAANKGWLDDVGRAVQIGATIASMAQSKGFQPQAVDKGWLDGVGQALQIGTTIVGALQNKSFVPGGSFPWMNGGTPPFVDPAYTM